jgi:hypothetical protein
MATNGRTNDSNRADFRGLAMIENGWPEPDWSILEDHRGELPGFPLGCLPTPASAWVTRAAHGAGVTPAHIAVPVLGVVGGLVGCARKVQASASWSDVARQSG